MTLHHTFFPAPWWQKNFHFLVCANPKNKPQKRNKTIAKVILFTLFPLCFNHRFGLLYRAGVLLLAKLLSDGFFIVYVNLSLDTLWAYPFGISCIILVSIVYPVESQVDLPITIQLSTTIKYISGWEYVRFRLQSHLMLQLSGAALAETISLSGLEGAGRIMQIAFRFYFRQRRLI